MLEPEKPDRKEAEDLLKVRDILEVSFKTLAAAGYQASIETMEKLAVYSLYIFKDMADGRRMSARVNIPNGFIRE